MLEWIFSRDGVLITCLFGVVSIMVLIAIGPGLTGALEDLETSGLGTSNSSVEVLAITVPAHVRADSQWQEEPTGRICNSSNGPRINEVALLAILADLAPGGIYADLDLWSQTLSDDVAVAMGRTVFEASDVPVQNELQRFTFLKQTLREMLYQGVCPNISNNAIGKILEFMIRVGFIFP